MLRRSSAAVATSREGHRKRQSAPGDPRPRQDRGRAIAAFRRTEFMEYQRDDDDLFGLDVGRSDDFRPFGNFATLILSPGDVPHPPLHVGGHRAGEIRATTHIGRATTPPGAPFAYLVGMVSTVSADR
jgi:hypothetical protein